METIDLIKPFGPGHPVFLMIDELRSINYFFRPSKAKKKKINLLKSEILAFGEEYVFKVESLSQEQIHYFELRVLPSLINIENLLNDYTSIKLSMTPTQEAFFPLETIIEVLNEFYTNVFYAHPKQPYSPPPKIKLVEKETQKSKIGKMLRSKEMEEITDISKNYSPNSIAKIIAERLGANQTSVQPVVSAYMHEKKGENYDRMKYPY